MKASNSDTYKYLAENIKTLRKKKSLTQEKLAELLGVTTGAVYKWESAQSVPEITLMMELAEIFEV
ncbi:MAG: helix-turn-helix transcriptional regulator, partial [Bacteroidaceae bacterium]|nr:helix-turn-helix transcriptional regulator [Bacteroidaceae bacterium]